MSETAATEQKVGRKPGSGGARAGAGRKSTREKFARPVAAAEKKIADKLPQIVDAAIELALGVTVQETNEKGEPYVYTRPPCYRSTQYLINRILGSPTQVQEVTGKDGGPIETKDVTPSDDPARIARVMALLDRARERRDRAGTDDA